MQSEEQKQNKSKQILVTGGAGYIGSHTVLELLKHNFDVVVFDNFEKSSLSNLNKVKELTGKDIEVVEGDIRNPEDLASLFNNYCFDAVLHFAAYKNAGESVVNPRKYYENNLVGSINLLNALIDHKVANFVFSSTCSVYGNAKEVPITEDSITDPISPYGKSKRTVEMILEDYNVTYGLNSIILRYFNVAGADKSGLIGEDSTSTANIIPLIIENLLGRKTGLVLFGNKYPTKDGFQERDYIHVSDLARAHRMALEKLLANATENKISEEKSTLDSNLGSTDTSDSPSFDILNLGTGVPSSNLELIKLAEEVSGLKLSYTVGEPRAGDPVSAFANPAKAKQVLDWQAENDIRDIIKDAWNWHSR